MRIIAGGVAAAVALTAAVLGGCGSGQNRSTPDGPTAPGATVTGDPPNSRILPALVLPSGSRLGHTETMENGSRVESWYAPLGFSETAESLRDLLPINRQFADLDYAGENSGIDKWGAEYVQWSWDNRHDSSEDIVRTIEVHAVDEPDDWTLVAVGVDDGRIR